MYSKKQNDKRKNRDSDKFELRKNKNFKRRKRELKEMEPENGN